MVPRAPAAVGEEVGGVCELLRRAREILEKGRGEIPAADLALFHVKRAAELARCGGEARGEEEKLLRRRLVVVE
jgi:hypothetical protein